MGTMVTSYCKSNNGISYVGNPLLQIKSWAFQSDWLTNIRGISGVEYDLHLTRLKFWLENLPTPCAIECYAEEIFNSHWCHKKTWVLQMKILMIIFLLLNLY